MFAVEEALLSGRFHRYALRRLSAFGLARAWGTFLHVVELTWLVEVFSAKAFVASLALQNITLVLDAAWFGALEALRRRARTLRQGMEATELTARWLTLASWIAIVVLVLFGGRALVDWGEEGKTPTLFHLYALACGVRLAADVVLRTYYSGVFAHHRVYRPVWLPLVTPAVLVGGTLALWKSLAGYAFVVALLASIVASRVPLYLYTRRAYRMRRIPQPRWRLRLPRELPRFSDVRDAVLAGFANTGTRLGAVVLVAAVIPSLAKPDLSFLEEEPTVEPFAFALHLASPLLFLASQWWLVFYHDWKRLEGEPAAVLARQLHTRLIAIAVVLGVVSWLGAAGLVLIYVPWGETWRTLLALAPATIGVSVWTALQLRGFARGEFARQVASAGAMLVALWLALSSEWLGTITWYLGLGAAPWVAIGIALALGYVQSTHKTGRLDTVAQWMRALESTRAPVAVWLARVTQRGPHVALRLARELDDRGAMVQAGTRLLWFEREPARDRVAWLSCAAGTIVRLEHLAPAPGRDQACSLEKAGLVRLPESGELDELARAHARFFPDGFVLHVGRRPPSSFLALPATQRQAIWRDAVRAQRGIRGRSGWFVTAYAPRGAAEILYVTRRPVKAGPAGEWHGLLRRHGFRVFVTES